MPSIGGVGGSPSGSSGPSPGSSGIAGIFGGNFPGDELSFDRGSGVPGGFGGISGRDLADLILSFAIPQPFGLVQGAAALSGRGFGSIAQGGLGGYTGGGPTIGSTLAQRALTTPIRAAAFAPPVAAKPPVEKPKIFDPKKKRIGRQETILTSGLSDEPTFKPTLLGQ